MAISYPISLSLPAGAAKVKLRQMTLTGVSFSPWSKVKETQEWPGSRWGLDLSVPVALRQNARGLFAQVASLHGPVGSALIGDPESTLPIGSSAGTGVTVNGAHAAGIYTLAVLGGTGTLLKGTLLQLSSGSTTRLHMILADVTLPGVTLDIWPSLRGAVTGGSTVTLLSAKGKFMLEPGFDLEDAVDEHKHHRVVTLPFIEDLSS